MKRARTLIVALVISMGVVAAVGGVADHTAFSARTTVHNVAGDNYPPPPNIAIGG